MDFNEWVDGQYWSIKYDFMSLKRKEEALSKFRKEFNFKFKNSNINDFRKANEFRQAFERFLENFPRVSYGLRLWRSINESQWGVRELNECEPEEIYFLRRIVEDPNLTHLIEETLMFAIEKNPDKSDLAHNIVNKGHYFGLSSKHHADCLELDRLSKP